MGTISHHQAKALEFLQRADRAIANHDPAQEAAAALRRAASHAATALAVNAGWKHKSRRQLETVLHAAVSGDTLCRSHLKTFRQAHTQAQALSLRGATRRGNPDAPTLSLRAQRGNPAIKPPAHPEPVEGRAGNPNHPVHPVHRCKDTPATRLRRLRRRVAALIKAAAAIIAGQPKPVRHHKRWQRDPNLLVAPNFTHIQDIIRLPNFQDIRQRFGLHHVALSAMPDPHGCYARGDTPRPCPCHPELWNQPENPNRITLAPPWQKALEKTFGIKLPENLQLTC